MQVTDSPVAASLDYASLAAWLRLEQTPGLGRVSARALLDSYGSPQALFAAAAEAGGAAGGAELPDGAMAAPAPAQPPSTAAPVAAGGAAAMTAAVHGAAEAAAFPPSRESRVPDPAPARLTARQAQVLAAPASAALQRLSEATWAWLQEPGNRVLSLHDPAYPPLLLQIADPPLLLYVKGRAELLQAPAVAIVGSRNASLQGEANAQRFAQALSAAGLGIVSGLALGIDAAAHRGGLAGGASTIAVIATGADRIYPRRNAALARQIAEQGCLISEFALGTPPRDHHFPRRNRIISGLARGVLVVEAAERSGSLITARQATAQNRDVFAIPGSIHSPLSKGCHILIREGAKLVDTVEHVLEELGWEASLLECPAAQLVGHAAANSVADTSDHADVATAVAAPRQWSACADRLLAALGHDPLPAGALAARLQLATSMVQAHLLALELAGAVERLPGGAFRRLAG
ncbi:DNA-processing protein DprA [Massilia sp. YIM B04103]|uniref:DNA-processing protein DprA n=1 Tax=Massilia sp. YIM B04103 TaxID=2963106 RepID=UPI00210C9F4D